MAACAAHAADPWADRVVSHASGAGAVPSYSDPLTALGMPERFTGEGVFPGAVTPFNPAWGGDELVSVGAGGHLIVAFDEPVVDDPANPYGLDLIVFGNAGFIDDFYPDGTVRPDGMLFGEGQLPLVEVSPDGVAWAPVTARIDALFPSLGYRDLTDPYSTSPGSVVSDFTKPVNPALNLAGMTFAQLVAAYDGSGGGTGIDLAGTGFWAISYVRFTNVSTSPAAFEVEALADVSAVPAPGTVGLLALVGVCASRRRREL